MANKVLSLMSSVVSHFRTAATFSTPLMTRCILQHNSPPTLAAGRALSTVPSTTFLGCKFSDAKSESSRCAHSLFTCGSRSHRAVLVSGFTPGALQVRCYQNTLRPRLICPGCYFVWRHNRKFVECSDHPRHKQMKTVATRKVWQEDYSKGEIYKAMDWNRRFPRQFLRLADRTMLSHNWLDGKIGKEM